MKIDRHTPTRVTAGLSRRRSASAFESLLRELGDPGLSAVQVAAIIALVFLLPVIAGLWH